MNQRLQHPVRLAAAFAATAAIILAPSGIAQATPSTSAEPGTAPVAPRDLPADPADGTIDGAIQWFQEHEGDTSYEGYCEMAVENAYGTTGVWPSAIDHWYGAINAGKAHEGDTNPPKGAFVYWNTSEYGHVGIADGEGGFYSSSIDGAIGHSTDLSYFSNYLGWSDPQVPATP